MQNFAPSGRTGHPRADVILSPPTQDPADEHDERPRDRPPDRRAPTPTAPPPSAPVSSVALAIAGRIMVIVIGFGAPPRARRGSARPGPRRHVPAGGRG